ncbi:hypothetical protein ACZ91_41120 [Streptomyces regensis]|nr:hypothetical protein ACZ91_41120 [Streptomyces regensis]
MLVSVRDLERTYRGGVEALRGVSFDVRRGSRFGIVGESGSGKSTVVGLPGDAGRKYPHQFSGGQRQRISIARALAPRPEVLIADEAVSALDVLVRKQILDLLDRLAGEFSLTMVFVSHDLGVVRRVCDEVAVMRRGEIVEQGPVADVYDAPRSEYTRSLVAAAPTLETVLSEKE